MRNQPFAMYSLKAIAGVYPEPRLFAALKRSA
jgi:hypothetical protein